MLVKRGLGTTGSVTARFFEVGLAGLGEVKGIAGWIYLRFFRAVRGFSAEEGEASGVGGIGLFSYLSRWAADGVLIRDCTWPTVHELVSGKESLGGVTLGSLTLGACAWDIVPIQNVTLVMNDGVLPQ